MKLAFRRILIAVRDRRETNPVVPPAGRCDIVLSEHSHHHLSKEGFYQVPSHRDSLCTEQLSNGQKRMGYECMPSLAFLLSNYRYTHALHEFRNCRLRPPRILDDINMYLLYEVI